MKPRSTDEPRWTHVDVALLVASLLLAVLIAAGATALMAAGERGWAKTRGDQFPGDSMGRVERSLT